MTASFQISSRPSAPAMAMPILVIRARRRRECALAAETAMRSSAEGSCGTSVMALAFEQRADLARQPDVFGMAEGLGGDARPRQIDLQLADDASGARRHHDDAVAEENRLVDGVGDQHYGLAAREPDALQLG